ncbi:hypothetical protein Y032_1465g3884, partial [Ancylostoma ceylanicum]
MHTIVAWPTRRAAPSMNFAQYRMIMGPAAYDSATRRNTVDMAAT